MASVTFRGLAGESAYRVPFVANAAADLSVTVGGSPAAFTFANGVVTLTSPLGSPADVVISDGPSQIETKFGRDVVEVGKTQQIVLDAVIPAAGTDTPIIDLGNFRLVGITMPATFTGTTLTPKSSYDGTTANLIYDNAGGQKTFTVAANRRIIVNPPDFLGVRYVMFTSSSTEASARTIKLICEA